MWNARDSAGVIFAGEVGVRVVAVLPTVARSGVRRTVSMCGQNWEHCQFCFRLRAIDVRGPVVRTCDGPLTGNLLLFRVPYFDRQRLPVVQFSARSQRGV